MWAQEQGRDCPSVLGTVRLCPVLSPHSKGDIEGLEPVQSWEQLEKKRLRGDLALHNSLTGGDSWEGMSGSAPRQQQDKRERPQDVPGKVQDGHQEGFF